MSSPITGAARLGPPPWPTLDPFLFCVHHEDHYPPGDADMGPAASLAGRRLGMDFEGKDGWRMYHGHRIPGFPRHPHRGFETVTLARQGYIDHADSLGATARFGRGDVQWMTAGRGIEHSEMFPLLRRDAPNPTELFQLWLNLPAKSKLVDPHFTMFWRPTLPRPVFTDEAGRAVEVTLVAGTLGEERAPAPPPSSWAADPDAEVAIWPMRFEAGARWTLPPGSAGLHRALYFVRGERMRVADQDVDPKTVLVLRSDRPVPLENGGAPAELLLLQGRPIGEPVVQHGPFVMNTRDEIRAAIHDYQRGAFGRWPWPSDAPVHPRDAGRFAVHADGRRETPPDDG